MTISTTSKIFHSIVGIGMIGLIAMGLYMAETSSYGLYGIHKSLGVIVLAFALYRVYNRMREGWPKPLQNDQSAAQLMVAKLIHWGLIVSTLMYPISGVAMSVAEGRGLSVFGLQLVSANIDPVSDERVPLSETISSVAESLHGSLYWFVLAFLALHIAGALKHHFIDKDDTLKRMFRFKANS